MRKGTPYFSIILATYNRADFLPETIQSILNQNFTNWELIIVDDGSTDNTRDVVKIFDDSRIKYFYQPNSGRSKARNVAISRCSGEVISFIDSDDLFCTNKLGVEFEAFRQFPDSTWCYSTCKCEEFPSGITLGYYFADESFFVYEKCAFYKPLTMATSQLSVLRESLPPQPIFDETLNRFEDTDLFRRLAQKSNPIALAQVLVTLRSHYDNSISLENPKILHSQIKRYLKKVWTEDDRLNLNKKLYGSSKLYEHYGAAFFSQKKTRKSSLNFYFSSFILYPPVSILSLTKNSYRSLKVLSALKKR
jgi:glycosyltransferase involved in cell wall biosynthesis